MNKSKITKKPFRKNAISLDPIDLSFSLIFLIANFKHNF